MPNKNIKIKSLKREEREVYLEKQNKIRKGRLLREKLERTTRKKQKFIKVVKTLKVIN
tara:strand:+ start:463 stop:636 length:174 start_codon:yes stop_codon:yes gene_type:complete